MTSNQNLVNQIIKVNELERIKTLGVTALRIIAEADRQSSVEARMRSRLGPSCECIPSIVLPNRQLATRKQQACDSASIDIHNETTEEIEIRSNFTPLASLECLTAAIKYRSRLASMIITAKNHDATLFSTDSSGTIHNQVIHYPVESDQIFGACDCLRYRNTYRPCEHLAFIALTEFFSSAFQSALAVTRT